MVHAREVGHGRKAKSFMQVICRLGMHRRAVFSSQLENKRTSSAFLHISELPHIDQLGMLVYEELFRDREHTLGASIIEVDGGTVQEQLS